MNIPRDEDVSPAALRARLVNEGAEQALLGALMIDNRAYLAVSDVLTMEQFGVAVHARIFAAIANIVESGAAANPVTMANYFAADEALREFGAAAYLTRLAVSAVTIVNAEDYARTIADLAQRRDLLTACEDISADASIVDINRPATTIIEEHERRIAEVAEGRRTGTRSMVSLARAARQAIVNAEAAHKGVMPFVHTGLLTLDRIIGGLLPGDLEVVAARPGIGKTAAALGISVKAASDGKPVLFFSLEQPAEQLAQRVLARYSGISADRQQHGDLDGRDWDRYLQEEANISFLPIHFDDTPGLTAGQIAARARRAKRRHKVELVVIDHLQLIGAAPGRSESRRLEIDDATRKLKALAKDLNLPVLLLSQLNRAVESRDDKRPTLADLRESGSIEQDADRVIFIYREEYYLRPPQRRQGENDTAWKERQEDYDANAQRVHGIADIIVAKNRHGRPGHAKVHWDAARMCFDDLEWAQR